MSSNLQKGSFVQQRIKMKYWKHFLSLLRHKWLVFRAGLFVGGIPLWRLIIHDWSKFSPTEMFGYAGNIGGTADRKAWARSWLHHLHCNPHHPEHWILSWRGNLEFYDEIGDHIAPFVTLLPMPETYVREWVADMMGTGKSVTGFWDISVWLNENGPSFQIHPKTLQRLDGVLAGIGIVCTDNCPWSYMAMDSFRKWAKEFYVEPDY